MKKILIKLIQSIFLVPLAIVVTLLVIPFALLGLLIAIPAETIDYIWR